MRWWFFLMLFSGVAQAISVQGLINEYGKRPVAEVIKERTRGKLTITDGGTFHNPAMEFVNSRTIEIDFKKLGLTARGVEKILITKKIEKERLRVEDEKEQARLNKIREKRGRQARVTQAYDRLNYLAPINYRSTIKGYINSTLFDPYSMRDLTISKPVSRLVKKASSGLKVGQMVSVVYVSFNAKNRFGAYVGKSEYIYIFRGERLVIAQKR